MQLYPVHVLWYNNTGVCFVVYGTPAFILYSTAAKNTAVTETMLRDRGPQQGPPTPNINIHLPVLQRTGTEGLGEMATLPARSGL